jgi:TaqI-like C-terminal specificity domain/Eco57I restriction-modification methylase
LIENKTPKQVAKLRILDPACGSGSFLIGAYQYLLDWHRDWFASHDPKKSATGRNPVLYQAPGGEWKLTTAERKRILLQNIFGVDIDAQAVETTKLSLLLKVLEGESEQTLATQLRFYHERALPDLGRNIKCGNSLIGPDFYEQSEMLFLDEGERYRINVFDWNTQFSEIIKAGGFDAIIGNPPYVDIKTLPEMDAEYIFATYPSANNRINLFAAFLERSVLLANQSNFRVSMIVPTAVLTQESYKELRKKIIGSYEVVSVVRIPNESFGAAAGNVKVDTVILVFGPKPKIPRTIDAISYAGYQRINQIDPSTAHVRARIPRQNWTRPPDFVWALNLGTQEEAILGKCEKGARLLQDCAEFSLGLTPYDKYKGHTESQIRDEVFHADRRKDKTFKPLLRGNDVTRYLVRWNGNRWISYGPWLGAPREGRFFTDKRILVKQIIDWTTKRIWAAITDEELYNTQNAFNLLPKEGWRLEYLLGLINSRLMTFYHRKKFLDEFKMRFQKILIKDCRRFPIHPISSTNPADKARHDRIVELVERMLALHKQLATAKTAHAKTNIQRQIDATDAQIDKLVYELYDLSADEIKIVEAAAK